MPRCAGGLRGPSLLFVVIGAVTLSGYGLIVTFLFKDVVPMSTWLGLALFVAGGLVIQFGNR